LPLAVAALAGCDGNASLYLFAGDSGPTSACTGAGAVNRPPLRVRSISLVGSGAKPSDVGRTARPNGISQLTYNGHPLYTFVNDKQPSDTNGKGINAFGGSWFAVSPAGARVAPRSQPQGGGRYGGY
jgi:predicted lipoprotein with Yx(FWY)xxD motif